MEFRILDLSNVTEEELLACLDHNMVAAKMRRKEIDELRRIASMSKEKDTNLDQEKGNVTIPIPIKIPCQTEEFEEEVDYYYAYLQKLSITNLEEKIEEALPSRSNPNYQELMQRLKAEVLKGIKELKVFALTEKVGLEEMEEFKREILTEQRKIAIIDTLLEEKEKEKAQGEEEEDKKENNLIFVPTSYGTIRALEEMGRITEEYYTDFLSLFQSIKNSTFKRVKRFSSNSALAGLAEVRGFQTRVAFARLDKNSYAIITAFTKKSDNAKGYRTTLENAYVNFQRMENNLKANLGSEEFMALNRQYEDELFRILSREKETPVVKRKEVQNG